MADPNGKFLKKLDEVIQRLQVIDEMGHHLQSIEKSCRSIVDYLRRLDSDGRTTSRDQRHQTRDDQPARLIETRRSRAPPPPDSPASPVSPLRHVVSSPRYEPTPPRPEPKPEPRPEQKQIPKAPTPDKKAPVPSPERKEPPRPSKPPSTRSPTDSGFFQDDADDFQFDE
jgi:hypothetical protein